jgi:hypothetical protein
VDKDFVHHLHLEEKKLQESRELEVIDGRLIKSGAITSVPNEVTVLPDCAWIGMDPTPRCHNQIPEPKAWPPKQLLPTALPTPLERMGMG